MDKLSFLEVIAAMAVFVSLLLAVFVNGKNRKKTGKQIICSVPPV
ncbi:hypothetical protein [Chryseobacterium sp. W4I1]|nr:hypothetical protein [Chryseobacterium sp. W4I1]MDQ0782324.1 hypothetical protein [Chryseobacterium sp. W4I1]